MALGSVAISGGMSKKTKERLMYMDGKLVWSSSSFSGTVPDTVDYLIVKNVAPKSTGFLHTARVARGGNGCIALYQKTSNYNSGTWGLSYATLTFKADGSLSMSYPGLSYDSQLHIEGYQYI